MKREKEKRRPLPSNDLAAAIKLSELLVNAAIQAYHRAFSIVQSKGMCTGRVITCSHEPAFNAYACNALRNKCTTRGTRNSNCPLRCLLLVALWNTCTVYLPSPFLFLLFLPPLSLYSSPRAVYYVRVLRTTTTKSPPPPP